MIKIKNFQIKIRHLITALAGLGMLTGFIASLCSKKKGVSAVVFFSSFAAFVAGLSVETGLVPEPECLKNTEIEFENEADEKLAKLKEKWEKLFAKKAKEVTEELPEEEAEEETVVDCSDACSVESGETVEENHETL